METAYAIICKGNIQMVTLSILGKKRITPSLRIFTFQIRSPLTLKRLMPTVVDKDINEKNTKFAYWESENHF